MASLSLPRVLQLKKNSLDAEREQFEKFQTLAIQKAINAIETPVKEKHVRSTIIGTFQETSAITYWMVALRLPLQDNRIVSWKFCHVTHKLLREGHPACLGDSQRHINMIENLGKLWVHLREGYGKLVHLYCNLLVTKLKFHARNPRFPGNMQLTADELVSIAENDVNNYFQICVELFDYMDDILTLQAAVFLSLGNARANSMTASGQCRLAALIPCAQDASQIYDCNVRLLFQLHASLPPDTLQGHRERFRQQFKKLSSFYKHASSLQYYRNLLTLPVLPSNPPNFLLQSDFGTYVTPVVTIPELPPDEVDSVASLIDTSDTMSQVSQEPMEDSFERPSQSPQPDPVVERDRLIDHLQNELKRMRSEVSQLVQERNTMLSSMREHCTRLETQLQSSHMELQEEKQKAEILSAQTPEIQQKLTQTEEKAKIQDEKFQKLKGAYTQLREEHISLIRQKAEVDKLSASLRAAAAQHESAKVQLQQQLNDRSKDIELLQQSASSSEEIEQYHNQISELRTELEKSRQKEHTLETVKASLEALEIEHQTTKTEYEDKMNTISNELKEVNENLELTNREKEEKETELSRIKAELVGLRETSGDEYKKVVGEKEEALKQVAELTQQYQQDKEELTHEMNDSIQKLQEEIENLQQELVDTESNYAMECERLNEELTEKHTELDNNLADKNNEIKVALEKLAEVERELEMTKISYENKLEDLASHKDHEINSLNEEMQTIVEKNNNEITNLRMILDETSQSGELHKSERIELSLKVNELENLILEKTKEIEKVQCKFDELSLELEKRTVNYANEVKENKHQLKLLENKLQNVSESKDENINNFKIMVSDKDDKVIALNIEITKLTEEVSRLSEQLDETQAELEIGNNELITLQEEHQNLITKNDQNLRKILDEASRSDEQQKSERIELSLKVKELENVIQEKTKEIEEANHKLVVLSSELETIKVEHVNEVKENKNELELLENSLQNVTESKDEIINNFKNMVSDKDTKIIALNVDITKLTEEVSRLSEQLEETEAHLEIGNSELITLKEEHDNIIQRSDENLALKNQELRDLHEEVTALKESKNQLEIKMIRSLGEEKQVLEEKILELKREKAILTADYETFKLDQDILTSKLKTDLTNLQSEFEQMKNDKDNEIKALTEQTQSQHKIMIEFETNYEGIKTKLEGIQNLRAKEKEDMDFIVSEKDSGYQMMDARISHIETKRLNAECELQDLLQHNTILEADVTSMKKQLEIAQRTIQEQNIKLVTCSSEAAVEVVNNALVSLDRANAQESNKAAAELAAKALEDIAKYSEIKGNEESIAKSSVYAAHNAAQLSNYVAEVANTSTNIELADKLNNECRSMLTATKECLESLSRGEVGSSKEAKDLVRSMAAAVTSADEAGTGGRSVDDELADMDLAIEQAASKIEEMLAASRAGDSGVQLEVNEKILDACTTLMAAVKILVQDSRALQNELGDPTTRQNMYRKNPQWSEGLISASKDVVFAAKLLVSSADDVVGSNGGRVEGVSAAAHEVAGATAQLVAASRARAPPAAPTLAKLTHASRHVAAAVGALVAAVRSAAQRHRDADALDTSTLTLTATRILEMESKVRSLELESALEAERVRLAALRKRHYQLAQAEENGNVTNGKDK